MSRKGPYGDFEFVQFVPACGDKYEKSDLGQKLMILGESHYPWKTSPKDKSSTTSEAIKAKDSHPFWGRVASLFSRDPEFWDQVVFYNFAQHWANEPSPCTESIFECEHTVGGFREVCQAYAPNRILVLGKLTWRMLPGSEDPSQYPQPRTESCFPLGEAFRRALPADDANACWYPISGGRFALAAGIFHPSPRNPLFARHFDENRTTAQRLLQSW